LRIGGGGLFIWSGSVELNDRSGIVGNLALENGGGIAISSGGTAVTVTLNDSSRITGNVGWAGGSGGGGIHWPAGTVTLNHDSYVSGNHPQDFDPPRSSSSGDFRRAAYEHAGRRGT
jgi:hypothetical protein